MRVTVFLLLLTTVLADPYASEGECPLSGCSPNRCYCIQQPLGLIREPKLAWQRKPASGKLSTKGCVANGDNIVCPFEAEENEEKKGKGCLGVHADGVYEWECSSLRPGIPLPLVDTSGKVIASDGHYLVAYSSYGVPLSKPIYLFPEEGGLFDLVITDNNFFIMIYKCGFIAATDTNGIPWASVFLNDTYNSMQGTFVPLATPAIVGERMYLPTAFWPHNSNGSNNKEFYLRLYAIDITDAQVDRIRVVWTMTKTVTGYLPTLEGNYKDCTLTPPPTGRSLSALGLRPIGHVTVLNDTLVVLGLNFNSAPGGYDRYLVIGAVDNGKTFDEKFYDDASNFLLVSTSSLNYITRRDRYNASSLQHTDVTVQDFFLMATVTSGSAAKVTTIDIAINDNQILGKINLDSLLSPLTSVQLTSDLMSFELDLPSKQDSRPPVSSMYVVFGFTGTTSNGTVQTGLAGIEIDIQASARLSWKIAMPHDCSPAGLMPSLQRNEELLLIVSTQCSVAAYKL